MDDQEEEVPLPQSNIPLPNRQNPKFRQMNNPNSKKQYPAQQSNKTFLTFQTEPGNMNPHQRNHPQDLQDSILDFSPNKKFRSRNPTERPHPRIPFKSAGPTKKS